MIPIMKCVMVIRVFGQLTGVNIKVNITVLAFLSAAVAAHESNPDDIG
jgi:hypothetical protein